MNRRGTILIATMLVTFAIAGMVLVLCRSVRVQTIASANLAASIQADAIERGAEQYVLAMLEQGPEAIQSFTEDQFAAIQIGDAYFWVLRPDYGDPSLPRFGLTDEAGKLNINTAGFDHMRRLPGMTDDITVAIMDWRDRNDTPEGSFGAESSYYLSLPEPYYCKNDDFETVEELLMVRGMTREYLYGTGSAPPLGATISSTFSDFSGDPWLARGICDLLTVYGRRPNVPTTPGSTIGLGTVTDSDRTRLRTLLNQKQFPAARISTIMSSLANNYRDIFAFYFGVHLTRDEFEKIINNVNAGTPARTLVNIMSAPRDVLLCLIPDTTAVDNLMQQRPAYASSTSLAWLPDVLGPAAVGLANQTSSGLANLITTRTYQYSADICAVTGNGRAFKRCRIVVDTRNTPALIIYRRDNTTGGWPMDKQILASLRAGQGPGPAGLVASTKQKTPLGSAVRTIASSGGPLQ